MALYQHIPRSLALSSIIVLGLIACIATADTKTNVLVSYTGAKCHGAPTTTIPIGSAASDSCWQVDLANYVSSSCTNESGLVMAEYDKPGCEGPFRSEITNQVNLCRPSESGSKSTAYLCAGTSPFGVPVASGSPVPGDGTLSGSSKRYDNPADVPVGKPYRNWFNGHNCQGKYLYSDTFADITVNDDKCYRYDNTNTNAVCKPATDDSLGLLTINSYQSGCKDSPITVSKYTVGYCFYAQGQSFMVVCGNKGN